jgi:hypothetical protein
VWLRLYQEQSIAFSNETWSDADFQWPDRTFTDGHGWQDAHLFGQPVQFELPNYILSSHYVISLQF